MYRFPRASLKADSGFLEASLDFSKVDGKWTDERTDSPCILQDFVPSGSLRAAAQKRGRPTKEETGVLCESGQPTGKDSFPSLGGTKQREREWFSARSTVILKSGWW